MKEKLAELEKLTRQMLPKTQFSPCDPAVLKSVSQTLPLSPELITWYELAAPVSVYIPWTGNDLTLYSPAELVENQEGYRWFAGTRNPLDDWQEHWLVVGDVGADPFIAHTDKPGTPVSVAL